MHTLRRRDMRWKQYVSRLSIKKKIVFYSYLVVTPILLLISAVMFAGNYSDMEEEQNRRGISRVQNLETGLAELNQSISDLSTYICINTNIIQLLTADQPEELNKNSHLWTQRAPMNFIEDLMAIKGYIKTLAIYPENGVQPYLRCMDSSSYYSSIEEIKKTDMYQRAIEANGRKCWKRIEKNSSDVYWANQSEKIVLYREIYDLSHKTPLGYLVIGADAGKYQDFCEAALEDNGEGIFVLNADHERLISGGSVAEEIESVEEEFLAELSKKDSGSFLYADEVVYFQKNQESGEIICLLIPQIRMTNQLISMAYTPLMMLLGVLAGLFPVLTFISNVVTKPLKKVTKAMAKFQTGDFSQQVEADTMDEIGEVAVCFNSMVKDIRQLIDEKYVMELREKESELTALQAQINPHFLYNTLDSLYWQALEAGNEEIGENILALSNLFRQVLGEGKSTTTIAQECELVQEYLKVQRMRFSKRLEYVIDVEEEIREERIPKLILQPFAENAVVHGFENADTPCRIYVGAKRILGGIEFVVEDTGIGMTPEQVQAVLNMDDRERYKGQRVGRYAIKNVRERLTLMYRERFEMKVDSEPGKGTKITLRIFSEGADRQVYGKEIINRR